MIYSLQGLHFELDPKPDRRLTRVWFNNKDKISVGLFSVNNAYNAEDWGQRIIAAHRFMVNTDENCVRIDRAVMYGHLETLLHGSGWWPNPNQVRYKPEQPIQLIPWED